MSKSLREQLEENFESLKTDGVEEPEEKAEPVEIEEVEEKPEVAEPVEEATKEPEIEPPQAWTGQMKEKWRELPVDVKAEITRRENDFHKMVTSREGELRMGKELKEVIDPYMNDIRAAGVEPKALINDLLGTVSVLKNGSEEQKIQIMRNIAQGYGIDLGKVVQGNQDPLNMLYGELNALKQQMNPEAIKTMLQQEQENARIQSDISAFAANPANKHFETVKAAMAPLLASEQAKSLQEAYDMACWANPSIRAEMLKTQTNELAAKKKQEMDAKKKASMSITGSPSAITGNPAIPERSLRDDLAANLSAIKSSKI